jgi:outer membrane protein OmpA-like peptidoglycan-associated protein
MRDTLIPTWYSIDHRPVRAGLSALTYWGWYQSGDIPAPMALLGCDQYSIGTSRSVGINLISELPFWGDLSPWTFGPTIGFRKSKLSFDWAQVTRTAADTGVQNLTIRHDLIADQSVLSMGGRLAWQHSAFGLAGSVNVGYAFGQAYERSEHLVDPGAHLLSGLRDTIVGSGNLVKPYKLIPSIGLTAGYEVPLSDKLHAQPTLSAQWSPLGATSFWHGLEIGAGITVLYDITPRSERVPVYVHEQVPVHTTVGGPIPESPLKAWIEATAVDANGQESKVVTMQIEEVRTRHAYPILNYIFFDEASSAIPARYVQYASLSEAQSSFKGSESRDNIRLLDLYHETLNIIGARLRANPAATVTLTGSTSNTGAEQANIALARKRAQSVSEYLNRVWQIEPRRVRIDASVLPRRPSPSTTPQGQEENRRVEIAIAEPSGSQTSILDPVKVYNIEHLATPDRIQLHPSIEADTDIVSTYASISANGTELQSFRGNEAKKIWAPTEQMLRNLHDSLSIDFDVSDAAHHRAHAHNSIPLSVIRVSSDREERVERFSLILFGFDEAKLGERNDRVMSNVADLLSKMNVQRILVQGYTDETGTAQHNDELSEARAGEVKRTLDRLLAQHNVHLSVPILTEGRGSRDLLYDNALPEGRFFSRTVNVTVERAPGK